MKKILYIGWIGYGNLGDELMYDLFKEQVDKLEQAYEVKFVTCEENYMKHIDVRDFDLIVLGGGSILNGQGMIVSPMMINFLHHAILHGTKVMIWGSGIDWMDKETLLAMKKGKNIPIHMEEELTNKLQHIFTASEWAGVRGPLTFELFKRLGVTDSIHICGDPAFLLDTPTLPQAHLSKIIGVNWGTSFNNVYGANEEQVENEMVKALTTFIKQGYTIHFFVMWKPDLDATKRLYEKLNSDAVVLDTTLYNHITLLEKLREFEFTINFKLHANYLSLAVNVPFIPLGYRFKIYDFVQSVNLEDLLVAMDSQTIAKDLIKRKQWIDAERDSIKKSMATYKKEYAAKLLVPFERSLFLDEK